MKIIISPAKSLDFESKSPTTIHTIPDFLEHSKILNEVLKNKSAKELSSLMKISDKLGQLNYQRNQNWELPFTPKNSKQAVYAFTGDVYKGLDVNTISEDKISVLQNNLRIVSGLYGLLKPLDFIQPYRLEMGTKLPIHSAKNLYEFWGETLVNALNLEMDGNDFLVNLASNEYSKAIPSKKLHSKWITPVFKELKGDVYRVIAIHAKRARGLMTRYLVENNVSSIEGIKNFTVDNYCFSEQLSTDNELVFIR